MYLFLCLHLFITSHLLFSMLSSLCRGIPSRSLGHWRYSLDLYLHELFVSKISEDMLEVWFADIIFQYLFDSSESVWYLILVNVGLNILLKILCSVPWISHDVIVLISILFFFVAALH